MRLARIVAVLAMLSLLAALVPASRARAATDSHVQVLNLTDTDFWLGWLTDVPTTGTVYYGTTCAQAESQSNASSIDLNYGSTAHLVDVGGNQFTAGQTYYYIIVDDDGTVDTNGGHCYSATTLAQAAVTNGSDTMAGTIVTGSGCADPAGQVLVTATITHNGITSLPLGAATYNDGTWQLPTSYTLNPDGTATNPQNGDTVTLTASLAPDQIQSETFSYNMDSTGTQQVPPFCLNGTSTGSTAATPTPTATGTVTASPASALATSTPITAAATSTPMTSGIVPTSTPITLTAVPAASTPIPITSTPIPLPPSLTPSPITGVATPAAAQIPLRVGVSAAQVRRGQRQTVSVRSYRNATILLLALYPDGSGWYGCSGRTNSGGAWSCTWLVHSPRAGTVVVAVTASFGRLRRTFHRSFLVRP